MVRTTNTQEYKYSGQQNSVGWMKQLVNANIGSYAFV